MSDNYEREWASPDRRFSEAEKAREREAMADPDLSVTSPSTDSPTMASLIDALAHACWHVGANTIPSLEQVEALMRKRLATRAALEERITTIERDRDEAEKWCATFRKLIERRDSEILALRAQVDEARG